MKLKKHGSEGEVALKLDVSKACDRVEWSFLQNRMVSMGFDDMWVRWIMFCVSTISYSISFNGMSVAPITPKRGMRQGDPLSPYLFFLCVEGLSKALTTIATSANINGCKISLSAPAVTRLLFADNIFLFLRLRRSK